MEALVVEACHCEDRHEQVPQIADEGAAAYALQWVTVRCKEPTGKILPRMKRLSFKLSVTLIMKPSINMLRSCIIIGMAIIR